MNYIRVIIFIASFIIYANSAANSSTEFRELEIKIDTDYSPHTGSSLLTTATRFYQYLDDKYFHSTHNKIDLTNWTIRSAKAYLLEHQLANYAMVAQHEIYGHGYRARESGVDIISYKISPWDGYTTFLASQYNALFTTSKSAIIIGGMEATNHLAEKTKLHWLEHNHFDIPEALLYLSNYLDQTEYALKADKSDFNNSNDIVAYINNINTFYDNNVISVSNIKGKALLDLLDPFSWHAIAHVIDYIYSGNRNDSLYMFNLYNYRYLPGMRTTFTPFGIEINLLNYLITPDNIIHYIKLGYGKVKQKKFYRYSHQINNLFEYRNINFNAKFSLWYQPRLFTNNISNAPSRFGLAGFLDMSYPLTKSSNFLLEMGYKARGFIPAEPLKKSLIIRLGIKLYS